MDLLRASASPDRSLCILGAGNTNDVELPRLCAVYGEVHLADIDVRSVRRGVVRQGVSAAPNLRIHPPLDLTGALDRLGGPTPVRVDGVRIELEGQPFGVTASVGVVTQMMQSVVESRQPTEVTSRLSLTIRDRHLADLLRLTEPAGTAILVTDVVPTSTAPDLLMTAPSDLEARMAELVGAGNFFTGTNPYRIAALLEEDERLAAFVDDVRIVDPWLWAVAEDRQHLTCAIVATRSERAERGP